MESIDYKTRKILYELDGNARQSYSQIGKKTGLSKMTVAHRIQNLQDRGIIQNYYTLINPYALGFYGIAVLLRYQYANEKIRKEILNFFINYDNTWYVSTAEGSFDLVASIWISDVGKFLTFYNNLMMRYGEYLKNQLFRNYFQQYHYRHSYLLNKSDKKNDRDELAEICVGKRQNLDETEFKILHTIAYNARAPLTEIGKSVGKDAMTINQRIKKMKVNGIIQGFRAGFNASALGFKIINVDIHLRNYEKRYILIDQIKQNPHLIDIFTSIGNENLQFVFCVENVEQIHEIMHNVANKYSNLIKDYEYIIKTGLYKWNWIPGELIKKIGKR